VRRAATSKLFEQILSEGVERLAVRVCGRRVMAFGLIAAAEGVAAGAEVSGLQKSINKESRSL